MLFEGPLSVILSCRSRLERSAQRTYHPEFLLCNCLHLQHPRLKFIIFNQRRLERNQDLLGGPGFECARQSHLLLSLQQDQRRAHVLSEDHTCLRVNRRQLCTGNVSCDLGVPFCVRDEGVWVVRHVHA